MNEENEEAGGPQALDLSALELDQLIGLFIGILSAKAWQHMGLRVTPGKEDAEKDMVKAATAIDCVAYLAEKVGSHLPEDEASRLRSMVADLQLNYARQT
jgi:hypothetical protein